MRKLRSMTLQDSSTDDSLPETSAMSGMELCNPPTKDPEKRSKFTEEEEWKQMLRDSELNFNPCRTSDILIKRAIARHLIKRKSR